MIDVSEIDHAALHRHMGGIPLRSGLYYPTTPHTAVSTANTLGNGTGRFSPWRIRRTTTFSKIGAEVTAAGDSGSVLRIGIYADDGTGYPGALVLDAGTIAGDAIAVAEIATSFTLTPGLYWVGAVVQGVTTTQPTVRTIAMDLGGEMPLTGGTIPAAAAIPVVGFVGFSMTGALPAAWPTATPNTSGTAARVFVKTA